MKYRLTRVSDTMSRVSLGRDTIGWARRYDEAWVVTTRLGNGRGATAAEAFHDMVRGRNNHDAQRDGYKDARDMVETRNREVREHVALLNDVCGAPLFKVRRTKKLLV